MTRKPKDDQDPLFIMHPTPYGMHTEYYDLEEKIRQTAEKKLSEEQQSRLRALRVVREKRIEAVPGENLSHMTDQHPDYDRIDSSFPGGILNIISNAEYADKQARESFYRACGYCAIKCSMDYVTFKKLHPDTENISNLIIQIDKDPSTPCDPNGSQSAATIS